MANGRTWVLRLKKASRRTLLLAVVLPAIATLSFCREAVAVGREESSDSFLANQPGRFLRHGLDSERADERGDKGRRLEMALPVTGRELTDSPPSVEDSTILFLHVFKCAGSTLRDVLMTWAEKEGWDRAIVEACKVGARANTEHRICLNEINDLPNGKDDAGLLDGKKILAGHFLWDFRYYVKEPYLMITTLRNPLELFASAQQYMHRGSELATVTSVSRLVTQSMKIRLSWKDPIDVGFIRRFLDMDTATEIKPSYVYYPDEYEAVVGSALEHLREFWMVGVVEQFDGFLEVLKQSFDPSDSSSGFWVGAHRIRKNESPVDSKRVLDRIEPQLVKEFNSSSLGLQWQVYEEGLKLWDSKCREALPMESHQRFCTVPVS